LWNGDILLGDIERMQVRYGQTRTSKRRSSDNALLYERWPASGTGRGNANRTRLRDDRTFPCDPEACVPASGDDLQRRLEALRRIL
jgi:hypothetical protein